MTTETTERWEGNPGDAMRLLSERPLPSMGEAIVELRRQGFDALAEELTALRDKWARTAMRHAEADTARPIVLATPPKLMAGGERR